MNTCNCKYNKKTRSSIEYAKGAEARECMDSVIALKGKKIIGGGGKKKQTKPIHWFSQASQ